MYSVAWLGPDHSFLCHRCVAWYSMLDKDNANSEHCLFSELPSVTNRVRHTELRPQLIHCSLKFQGVERLNLQGVSCRPRFECSNLPYAVFDTRMLGGFKGAVNRWLLP